LVSLISEYRKHIIFEKVMLPNKEKYLLIQSTHKLKKSNTKGILFTLSESAALGGWGRRG